MVTPLLSGFMGGFLATGLVRIPKFGMVESWRQIYFWEGLISIILSALAMVFLLQSPTTARFLTAEQKELGVRRIRAESSINEHEKVKWRHVKAAVCNINSWFAAVLFSLFNVPTQSFFIFLATLIRAYVPKASN